MASKTCVDCGEPRKPRYKRCPACCYLRNKTRSGVRRRQAKEEQATRPRPPCCEVCGAKPEGRHKVLCWDHNHETGEFRGWLCMRCNTALGYVGDNPDIATALATYLENRGFAETRSLER